MHLRFSLKSGFVSIVCAYAPTLAASHDVKDEFYDALSAVLHQIPIQPGLHVWANTA